MTAIVPAAVQSRGRIQLDFIVFFMSELEALTSRCAVAAVAAAMGGRHGPRVHG